MNSLYQINQDLLDIFQQVDDQDGELTPEQETALEIKEGELQQKAVAYREVIGASETFITRIDDEIKRLQALKKQKQGLISRLKDNLLNAVKVFGEFEVGTVTFGTRKSSSVEVEDVNALPNELKKTKVTESADKAAIKRLLKEGAVVPGCQIIESVNLKIK
jgi:predicted nuclease with TOPRIM domain